MFVILGVCIGAVTCLRQETLIWDEDLESRGEGAAGVERADRLRVRRRGTWVDSTNECH